MKNSKVVGVVQARNEWPLLALSISHTLMNHVDEVYVLDHDSCDGTHQGLRQLQQVWKDRIHVLSCRDERFWQAATANALIALCQWSSSPEWIYVFDADEFLLSPGGELRRLLADLASSCSAVRYDVQNWIPSSNFREDGLNDYRTLRYRSIANLFIEMHPTTYVDEILRGNINFYDIPFPSKIIFRNSGPLWLEAGAHRTTDENPEDVFRPDADILRAAHFPFLSRERLDLKATQGQRLILDGFPATHGWQSQMVYRFAQLGLLDRFWSSQSISDSGDLSDRTLPSHVVDDGFVKATETTVGLLEDLVDRGKLSLTAKGNLPDQDSRGSQVPFESLVLLSRNLQQITESVRSERDRLFAESNRLLAERNAAIEECDNALASRDAAIQERDALLQSYSWRYTQFLRALLKYWGRTRKTMMADPGTAGYLR